MKTRLALLALLLLIAGCTPPPISELRATVEALLARFARGEAQLLLAQGIEDYEAGEYAEAAARLQAALAYDLPVHERVSAHKHLAFIYCAAELESACESEFRKALRADPAMDLDAAEAGHPIWGPVFQHVKAER
jgi:Tfp pilus assembly protein PilF